MKRAFSFIPAFFKIGGKKISTDETVQDHESLETIKALVTHWCVANGFLLRINTAVVPNIKADALDSKLKEYIYSLNFKRLCVNTYLQELLVLLQDTPHDKTTTRLVDLHIQIMTEVDPKFINLYINKLIHVLSELYPDDVYDHEWEVLFTQFPYLWLIYFIQNIMRSATPLP
jgi:hypothetical protein